MIDEPQLTRPELGRLGRSAILHEPHAPLVLLFPHDENVRDERIDGRMEISTRLRHVLDAWQGPLWEPYLAETPATVWLRRGLGYETFGEFLQLAVVAAGMLATTDTTDTTDTESSPSLLDRSSRSDDLARWATAWADLVAPSADRQIAPTRRTWRMPAERSWPPTRMPRFRISSPACASSRMSESMIG